MRPICSPRPSSAFGKFAHSQVKLNPSVNEPERRASSAMKYIGTTKNRTSQIAPGPSSP